MVPQIEVITYGGNRAIVRDDLYYELSFLTGGQPVGSTGGRHFTVHPERSIPNDVIAIPEDHFSVYDGDALLIAKRNGREVYDYE
jgi:hypothetical protein